MKRVPSFKKMIKDGKVFSPQGRRSLDPSSSLTPNFLEVSSQPRSRSSSNSSFTGMSEETSEKQNESGSPIPTTSSDKRNSAEFGVKMSSSPTALLVPLSASTASGMLQDASPPPNSPPLLNTFSSDSMSAPSGQLDYVDGILSQSEQKNNKQLTEHLKQKIIKTSEAIKSEQVIRDENVAEYLKLATNADKQQASRIKVVFEKKNQKSNANITQLQRKLDSYHRRFKDIDSSITKQGKSRDVVGNIRDISSGIVDTSKPSLLGLHNHAAKNSSDSNASKSIGSTSKLKSKSGSADDLTGFKDDEEMIEDFRARYGSAEDVSSNSGSICNYADYSFQMGTDSTWSGFHDIANNARGSVASVPDSPTGGINTRLDPRQLQAVASQLLTIKSELQESRKSYERLEMELEEKKEQMQRSFSCLLEEEKLRFEDQLNDLAELHQRGIAGLRQDMKSMEEKIEYHAHERARDIQEALESCQTRIAKMELQQQQLVSVSVEGLEDQNARALLGKLINLLLSVMAVLLVLVSTVSGILMPFVKSQRRLLASAIVAAALMIFYKEWDAILSLMNR